MAARSYNEALDILQSGGGGGGRQYVMGQTAAERYIMTESMWIDNANQEGQRARNLKLPRGKGIDTIFLIDASGSMEGELFQQAKTIVSDTIKSIQNMYKRHGLQENVALVTMGQETKVVHHLSSDYNAVAASLDTLSTGGKTPILAGLYMSLSAIVGRGSVTVMNGFHVHPRIIMLTDGKATDSATTHGADETFYAADEIYEEVVNVATRLGCESHQIYCIPLGDSPNEVLLEEVARVSKGKIVKLHEVGRLARHFKNLAAITRLKRSGVVDWRNQKSLTGILSASEQDMNEEDIEDIYEILLKTDNLHEVASIEEEFCYEELPQFGTRVERGAHWRNGDDDLNGPGTIVRHIRNKPGWVKVEWDRNGKRGEYRFGADDCYEVVETKQHRILKQTELIKPGCLVTRGDDWSYGYQDGGSGNIGVVYNVTDKTLVQVRWPNGHRNHYKFGTNGMFDVKIWEPGNTSPFPLVEESTPPQQHVPLPPRQTSPVMESWELTPRGPPNQEHGKKTDIPVSVSSDISTDGPKDVISGIPTTVQGMESLNERKPRIPQQTKKIETSEPDSKPIVQVQSKSSLGNMPVQEDTHEEPDVKAAENPDNLYLHKMVQWSWFVTKQNKFVNFPEEQNLKVEDAFRKKMLDHSSKAKTALVKIENVTYRINFATMKMRKVNDNMEFKVQRVDVPMPILGMTKEKIKQYFEAVLHGNRPSRNIRLMLVGHERVGKTSICRNLLKDKKTQPNKKVLNVDKSFKGDTKGTDGIDIYIHTYQINMNRNDRKKLDNTDQEIAVKKLANYMMEHQYRSCNVDVEDDDGDDDYEDDTSVFGDSDILNTPVLSGENEITTLAYGDDKIIKKGKHIFWPSKRQNQHNQERRIPNNVVEDVKNVILQSSETDVDDEIAFLSMWDFGGEDSFYDTHHIFLSSDAIYLVVFNIEECLNNEERHERVRFWLRSIASYWDEIQKDDKPQPPIIMVGTHIDKIQGSKEDKQQTFIEVCSKILEHSDMEPLKSKIVNYCSVDSESGNAEADELFETLWNSIIEEAPNQSQWNKTIPIKWFTLERELMKMKSEGKKIVTLKDIIDLDSRSEAPIKNEEEIVLFLKYLHLTGNILYFEDNDSSLSRCKHEEKKVIIDPQWVVYAFRRLITAPKFGQIKASMKWRFFQTSKELTLPLVDQFWSIEEDKCHGFCNHRDDLLKFMETAGLIAHPVSKTKPGERESSDYYIVPSLLKEVTKDEVRNIFDRRYLVKTRTLSIRFEMQYIPFPVYHKLLAVCIDRFERFKGDDQRNKLWRDFGCFKGNPVWSISIYCKKSTIKLTMFKIDDNAVINAGVGVEVREFVENTMKDILTMYGHQKRKNSYHLDNSPYLLENVSSCKVDDLASLDDSSKIPCDSEFFSKADLKPWFCSADEKGKPVSVPDFFPFMDRKPTNQELSQISMKIPLTEETNAFFRELGMEEECVKRVRFDNKGTGIANEIYELFMKWMQINNRGATYRCIVRALKRLDKNANFLKECILEQ